MKEIIILTKMNKIVIFFHSFSQSTQSESIEPGKIIENSTLTIESFYSVKYSTIDFKYLLFLQDFFFRLKQNSIKNANIADPQKRQMVNLFRFHNVINIEIVADCLKNIWKLIKQNKLTVELFDEKLQKINLLD